MVANTVEGCVFGDIPTSQCCAGAGLVSSLHDYSLFAEMLLNEGDRVVSKAMIEKMRTGQVSKKIMPTPNNWGYSVRVITGEEYGKLPVGCFGWSGAFGSHFWVDPTNKITAIYMKNSAYDGGAGSITGMNFETAVTCSLRK